MTDFQQEVLSFTASQDQEGARLDAAVSEWSQLSRARVQKLCQEGRVEVNGRPGEKNFRLKADDEIRVELPKPQPLEVAAQNIPLDIVYEDVHLLVVNKPKGMVVHPAPGNPDGTLVNALLYHCRDNLSGINGVLRPGIVHRIDKDTSGLLMVAKDDVTHQGLAEQIAAHSFLREYETVVYGRMAQEAGTVNLPIGRSKADRKKMCVCYDHSRPAVTHYRLLEQYRDFAHLKCRLETGRTHQIRVHMAAIGHPVAGDPVYGPKKIIERLHGQCLHAKTLGFVHPATGKWMEFTSPLPEYFQSFLNGLKKAD